MEKSQAQSPANVNDETMNKNWLHKKRYIYIYIIETKNNFNKKKEKTKMNEDQVKKKK